MTKSKQNNYSEPSNLKQNPNFVQQVLISTDVQPVEELDEDLDEDLDLLDLDPPPDPDDFLAESAKDEEDFALPLPLSLMPSFPTFILKQS